MENFEMKQVLSRYYVDGAHGMVYSFEEFKALGIDPDFIYCLLGLFEDPEEFTVTNFDRFSLHVIIDYVRKTHQYYLFKKLPEIEQSIHLLISAYPLAHPLLVVLHNFFADYQRDLTRHIEIEEKHLLPHITSLLLLQQTSGVVPGTESSYSIRRFFEQHHDTERDLREVREAMIQYDPPATNQTLYRILLSQLQVLEKDLAIHAIIEDKVLVPRAIELEKKLTNG